MDKNPETTSATTLLIKTALKSWTLHIQRINDIVERVGEDALSKEIAPGRNRGIYIFGHLVAVHDAMLPLLGFGEKMYPHLEAPFITNADNTDAVFPPLSELIKYWRDVNARLQQHFEKLTPEEWLDRHNAVSPADYEKEPHRNKFNVVMTRSHHVAYHYGQLALLKSRNA